MQLQDCQQEKLQGVSALTGVGISSLIDSIVNFLIPEAEAETEFIARGRHIIALECALEELTNISALLTTANPELLAEHYKASIKHVSKILFFEAIFRCLLLIILINQLDIYGGPAAIIISTSLGILFLYVINYLRKTKTIISALAFLILFTI